MSRDVLSQGEIDSLVSAVSRGEIEEEAPTSQQHYVEYDFRRPTKFSKEQIRTLQSVHDNYARSMGNFLSAYLRVTSRIKVLSVTQATYEEFLLSLPCPTLMTIFRMSPDLGMAMMGVDPLQALSMVVLTLGGRAETEDSSRELTEIEITVMKQISARFLHHLSYAWQGITSLEPWIESLDTNPQFNQVVVPSETVVLVTMSLDLGGQQGVINLCYPYVSIEDITPKLSAQVWFGGTTGAATREAVMSLNDFRPVEVEMEVCLGEKLIALEELMRLRVGQVLGLDRKETDDVEVRIDDRTAFRGQPGVSGKNMAIRFTRWANPVQSPASTAADQQLPAVDMEYASAPGTGSGV